MSMTYKRSVPYTSALGEASYYLMGRFVSNILIAENETYGKTINFPTESASWRTQYSGFEAKLEKRFNLLARNWEAETTFCSTVLEMSMHPAYQQIIGMGQRAIPFILRELDINGGHWFWALKAITGANPVPESIVGNLDGMRDAWVAWGRQQGYEF